MAAYASFFNMPWRMAGVPVATGMAAHALRWKLLQLGASVPMGAFGATLVAGTTMALVSHRLRLPFGAAAFASVVSLIPGIYMFHAASSLVMVARLGPNASLKLVLSGAADLSTAGLTLIAMAAGLIGTEAVHGCVDMAVEVRVPASGVGCMAVPSYRVFHGLRLAGPSLVNADAHPSRRPAKYTGQHRGAFYR